MRNSAIDPTEVYEFLIEIGDLLRIKGAADLANRVLAAGTYFRAPLTSEFYGETMLALQGVLAKEPTLLNQAQRDLAEFYAAEIKRRWFSPPAHRRKKR